jgi:two-component system, chemotaxis family, chemotaxis protein CheY
LDAIERRLKSRFWASRLKTSQFHREFLGSISIISFLPQSSFGTDVAEEGIRAAIANERRKEHTMTEYKSDLWFGALTGNGRVLVVDDEACVRKLVRMTLEKAGYDVLEAENGEAAIEAIQSGENRLVLDVVICDIRMPKINGIQAIEYFQKEYPHVPVIVLTAYPETEMAVSFMRNGMADYLVKPVEAQKLTAAVEKAMERRQLAWA